MKTVTLYFREGPSDKQYSAWIEAVAGGFLVQTAWGRRGGTQQTGCKTPNPVTHEAEKIWARAVGEKVSKGYQTGEAAAQVKVAPAPSEDGPAVVFVPPMLCNPIEEREAQALIRDDRWVMQPKFDGIRCQIHRISK